MISSIKRKRSALPQKIRYEVIESDIENSDCTCTNCPHARALKRRLGPSAIVRVYGTRLTIAFDGYRYTYSTPSYTNAFQAANDTTGRVHPGIATISRLGGSEGMKKISATPRKVLDKQYQGRGERAEAVKRIKEIDAQMQLWGDQLGPLSKETLSRQREEYEVRLAKAPRSRAKLAGGETHSHRRRTYSVRPEDIKPRRRA